jgi:hypothetical protein
MKRVMEPDGVIVAQQYKWTYIKMIEMVNFMLCTF